MTKLNHLKYLLCFFLPGCVVWFLSSGPHTAIEALLWTTPLWLLILLDWLSPKINPEINNQVSAIFYDAILYALAFLQFLIISLLLIYASQLEWGSAQEIIASGINLIVMRILVGTTSGSSALIVAHELIHRPRLHLRVLGRLLLYTVCYEHFVIAHIRGHHFSVATPEDIATARQDENFKNYWKRVSLEHFKYAWHSELKRLDLINTPIYHYKMLGNSVLQGLIIEIILLLLILIIFGWAAVLIFMYQALSGVRLLETINYYQHWGLAQGKAGNTLAWVNQSSITEYALIGLSHHIGHHQNAATSFYQTPYSDQGPKMPYGYFVTNLWVKINNKSYRRISTNILMQYLH
ncbi:MAG: fatty acid desaturase [Gammaproteobacteria bacterium]|nr:MAG: fatty acid desaturase [Gammaproteobacteria bacterium]